MTTADPPAEPAWLRDLRWLLLSPPLLSTDPGAHPAPVQHFDPVERALIEAWLADLARSPSTVPPPGLEAVQDPQGPDPGQVDGTSPTRLGRHAEQLLSHFLQAGPTHRGHAAHLPLRIDHPEGGTTTLGEIDFLVEDRHGRRWHWELAVKFFVCTAPASAVPGTVAHAGVGDYVGPQRRDSLDRKLHKLFQQQLRHRPPAPWDRHAWQPAAFVRGRLFYPRTRPVWAPEVLHPGHLRASWVPAEAGPGLVGAPGRWHRLPRSHWMAPGPAVGPAIEDATAMNALLQAAWAQPERRPVMLARRLDGCEVERVWVMPPGW